MRMPSPLPDDVVQRLIACWNGEPGSAICLNVGTNVVFRFRAEDQDLILRVHHTGDRKLEETEAEAHWVDFLHTHGAAVAAPVASTNGQWVEVSPWEGKDLLAVAFRRLPGSHPQLYSGAKWKRRLIRRVGATLGRIHALSRVYDPPPGLRRFNWTAIDLPRFAAAITPPEDAAYLANLESHWQWIQSLPQDDAESFGLVHGDFHSANLLVKRSRVGVIDFDGTCYNWFLFDIAHFLGNSVLSLGPLNAAERRASVQRLFLELMRGYARENRMKSGWFEFLPNFLRGFLLLYYFNLLANFHANPEQLKQAPNYEFVRRCVLEDLPLVQVDFRRLYKEAETPSLLRWLATHVLKMPAAEVSREDSPEGDDAGRDRTSTSW
jgi:amicoumacin kinase